MSEQGQERPRGPQYHGEDMAAWGKEWEKYALALEQRIRQLEEQLEAVKQERNQYIAEAKAYADDKYEAVAEMQNEIHALERAVEGAAGNADAFKRQRDAAQEQVKELKALVVKADSMLSFILHRDGLKEPHGGFNLTKDEVSQLVGELRLKADSLSTGEK